MKRKEIAAGLVVTVCLILAVFTPVAVGQTWTASGPIPRFSPSAVLDLSTNRMIVFGGGEYIANGSRQNLNDVWRLNGRSLVWTTVHPTGAPPAARISHTAVYAASSNRMIVFGGGLGNSSPCANDVWVLTNANGAGGTPAWIQLSPSGTAPAPRLEHGAAYDPTANSMIVYGGDDCFSTLFGDVWVLSHADGLGGTPVWTQLTTSGGGPGAREVHGQVVYDSANNTLIVFGGSNVTGFNDVWLLSHANGTGGTPTWTQLSTSGTPPSGRSDGSAVYDATHNRLTIFGGGNATGQLLNDVWVLSNANGLGGTPTWAQLGPFNLFPEARLSHSAVYNPPTNKMIVFAGLITANETLVTNDLWVLDHANGL